MRHLATKYSADSQWYGARSLVEEADDNLGIYL